MLGIMNSPSDQSVEFYSSARASSLYDAKKKQINYRTYAADGRVMINGEIEQLQSPDDMWKNVLTKTLASNYIKQQEKPRGAMAIIRRLSEKLSFKRPKTRKEKKTKKEGEKDVGDDRQHVTVIRIETNKETDRPDRVRIPREGILAKLMEEESCDLVDDVPEPARNVPIIKHF